jgi:hypothetical protein
MGIRVDAFGVKVGQVLQKCIENVGCFIGAAGNKAAEERDIIIGNVPIGDAAGFAIADMADATRTAESTNPNTRAASCR